MRVVSNTSPLSNLAVIGRLALIRDQFGEVAVPEAVWSELEQLEHPSGQAALQAARRSGWIKVERVEDQRLVTLLRQTLDRGEAEAIALACSTPTDRLLIDEQDGRDVAEDFRLAISGALGLLVRAKRAGSVASVKDEIDRLRHDAGFFVSAVLEKRILEMAGE